MMTILLCSVYALGAITTALVVAYMHKGKKTGKIKKCKYSWGECVFNPWARIFWSSVLWFVVAPLYALYKAIDIMANSAKQMIKFIVEDTNDN